jgi:hypothetical protein
MDEKMALRIVDRKTLTYTDKRDPRQVPADRLSDAALKANSNAIGFVHPPLFSEQEDRTLTIIAGPAPHQERHRGQAQGDGDPRQTGQNLRKFPGDRAGGLALTPRSRPWRGVSKGEGPGPRPAWWN